MPVFGRAAEPVAGIFLLLVQKKGTKEKDTRRLVGISNPHSLALKEKQAFRELGRCSAFFALKQTLTMILFLFRCSAVSNEVYPLRWYC